MRYAQLICPSIMLLATVWLTTDPVAQELNCQTCHGSHLQGNNITGAPALNLLSVPYVKAQLNAFKLGYRGNNPADQTGQDMRAAALQLSPADTEAALALVKILTLQETAAGPKKQSPPASWQSCVACHGPQGLGNDALLAPAIAGQHAWYVQKQLNDYQQNHRGAAPADQSGQMMRQVSLSLSADDIKQLSQFLSQSTQMEQK